mgnify:CR=1 FL=1
MRSSRIYKNLKYFRSKQLENREAREKKQIFGKSNQLILKSDQFNEAKRWQRTFRQRKLNLGSTWVQK